MKIKTGKMLRVWSGVPRGCCSVSVFRKFTAISLQCWCLVAQSYANMAKYWAILRSKALALPYSVRFWHYVLPLPHIPFSPLLWRAPSSQPGKGRQALAVQENILAFGLMDTYKDLHPLCYETGDWQRIRTADLYSIYCLKLVLDFKIFPHPSFLWYN